MKHKFNISNILQMEKDSKEESKTESKSNTKDKYFLHHVYFALLGTVSYLPILFFVTAHDYWLYKFRSPDEDNLHANRTELQKNFSSTYSATRQVTTTFSLLLGIIISRIFSVNIRTKVCLAIMFILFLVDLILVNINTDSWQLEFFILTMVITVLTTAPSDILYVTLLQFASKFPPEYLGSFLAGEPICGIGSALVQIICLFIGSGSIPTAIAYFTVGAALVTIGCAAHMAISRMEYFKYQQMLVTNGTKEEKITFKTIKNIVLSNKILLLGTVIEMTTSTVVSPSLAALVVSENAGHGNIWSDKYFVPVITFLLYSIMNLLGKMTVIKLMPKQKYVLFGFTIIRVGLIPMIMLCNAQPRKYLPVIFNRDYEYIILLIVFAYSGGILGSGQIMLMARKSPPEEKYLATYIIIYISVVSLGIFAFANVLLVNLI